MVPTFVFDRLAGRQPLLKQPPWLLAVKELSHSILFSLAIVMIGEWLHQLPILAFGVGMLLHVVIDILTHGEPSFQDIGDPHYLWPFCSLRRFGIWEYRIKTGQLWPVKPFEFAVLASSFFGAVYFWLA